MSKPVDSEYEIITKLKRKQKTGLPRRLSDKELACWCRRHGSTLVWEDSSCCGGTKPMHHNNWACALEPRNCKYWAHSPHLLKPVCPVAQAPQQKKIPQWEAMYCSHRGAPTEKSSSSNEDPASPKTDEYFFQKKETIIKYFIKIYSYLAQFLFKQEHGKW